MATLTIADLDNGKRDLQTVDAVANSRDDFTKSRYGDGVLTLAGALRRLGYQAPVPYATGLNVTTGLFTVERDGVVYAPVASRVPFTTGDWDESQWRVVQNTNDDRRAFVFQTKTEADIAAATLPEGQFVDALDVQERYKVNDGSLVFVELLNIYKAESSSAHRTWQDRAKESPQIGDYGAKGDGVSDDTEAFVSLERDYSGIEINLIGKTYLVSSIPTGNKYRNGYFKSGISEWPTPYGHSIRVTKSNVLLGTGSAPNINGYESSYAIIAIGNDSLANAGPSTKQQIAIGRNTLRASENGYYNIAIGLDAGMSLNGSSGEDGTRNVIVGDNAARFSVTTNNSVQIGRNANHTATGGAETTVVGSNAQSGWGPLDFSGGILNATPHSASYVSAFGSKALRFNQADQNSALGAQAGGNIKKGTANVFAGYRAGANLDSYLGRRGGIKTDINLAATYTQTGNVITVNLAAHGAPAGDYVEISITDGGAATTTTANLLQVQSVTADTFTVNSPISGSFSGNAFVHWRESATPAPNQSSYNVVMGGNALGDSTLSASNTVAIGQDALRFAYSNNNVAVGFAAGREITTGYSNTFLGRDAGRYMQNGSSNTSSINSVCLGFNSRVSGNGQIQLGDSTTTTYAYGAVQDRSDARDKSDVRDTVLGLDFINDLRPVDFKWDMRDDYVQHNEDGTVEILPKDGSKKRNRYHHGVIAQELRAVMEKHGVDFGGFQDHSVNGGCDVLSVGYTELISPLIKAVQELSARVKELEER